MPEKENYSLDQLTAIVEKLVKLQVGQVQKSESSSSFEKLAELLAQREKREAEKDALEQQRLKTLDEQYSKNAQGSINKDSSDWSRCNHLKGGKMAHRMPIKRTAVYPHVFPDGEFNIRCGICGMKWKERDTEEFLYRDRKFRPNPTGIGWEGALKLLANTDNTRSSSEVNPIVAADLRELRNKQFAEDLAKFKADPESMTTAF